MLYHAYTILIDRGVGAPEHGKDVVDSLRVTDKMFLIMLMTTVKLPGEATNNSQMSGHSYINE